MIELEDPDHASHRGGRIERQPEPFRGQPAGGWLRRDAGQRAASRAADSLEGAAVTSVQIAGVFHEFSTLENVKEDVTQIVLNVKKLRLRSFARQPSPSSW